MKKLTLIAMALAVTLSAGAQRKTWDFTKGFSAQTIAALQASVEAKKTWTDYEKNATSPEGAGKYYINTLGAVNGTACTYDADGNATPIPELEGLTFNNVKKKGFVIAYNYDQSEKADSPTGLYPNGKSFVWINGKGQSFTFRAPASTTLRLGIESHKNTEGRGFNVYVGNTRVTATSGNETPQFFNECVYDLPEATDGTDSLTVKIQSTNGAHLYYIIVGEGDEPQVEENKKIGYVYNPSVKPLSTVTYNFLSGGTYNVTSIPASATDVTLDSLQAFDAVLIDNDVPADAALVPTLKSAVAYEPVVNLDSKLYGAWGYGSEVAGSSASVDIKDANATLFKNWDGFDTEQTTLGILNEGSNVTGLHLEGYFAKDDTLATTGDAVAIHQHNPLRNTYIFLPYGGADLTMAANLDNFGPLLLAAVKTAAATKVNVTEATKPVVKQIYKDKLTKVALTAQNGANIYYTTDGTDPTTSSTLYSDTLSFTEPVTVKAIATLDGYLQSDITSEDIVIKAQAKTPEISVAQETGKSTVTITQADGVNIYYNFTGSDDVTASALYTAPFELTENATVTAFAIGGTFVQSETATKAVEILGQSAETLRTALLKNGHYNTSLWYDGSKAIYPFGRSATTCYVDPETKIMKAYDTADGKESCNTVDGWQVTSYGQVVTFENTTFGTAVGGDGYNPATITDALPIETSNQQGTVEITKYATTFGAKLEGEPYTASIRSKQAFQGPFDVVVYCANGNGTTAPEIAVKVSADETIADSLWTMLGDTIVENQARRLYKRSVVHYDGTDKVFVQVAQVGGGSKAMVADVYVLGTLKNADAIPTAIASVITDDASAKVVAIYGINGARQRALQRGVNIVRYSNGTVRKVLVK